MSGIGGLTVTLTDTTTKQTVTTTTSGTGSYSLDAPAGDAYVVCIASPTFKNLETAPTSGPACTGVGQAGRGYAITSLGSSGQSGLDFGFEPYGTLSGTVYDDQNQDGAYDSSPLPADTPLSGWSIALYDTSSATPGTPVTTATSDASGAYSVSLPFTPNHAYVVCETPPSAGTWVQTQPRSGSATCKTAGALPNGTAFTPTTASATETANFGNVPGVACTEPMGISGFRVLLPGSTGCKNNTFAFDSGNDANRNGKPFFSLLVGDPTQPLVPAAEKLTFADPIGANGQPLYTGLEYTDTFPVVESSVVAMPYCLVDPLDPGNTSDYEATAPTDLRLADPYTTASGSGAVVPAGATSCVISITTTAPTTAGGNGSLVAYVYSLVDSQAWPT
jgi:hypothetical protein